MAPELENQEAASEQTLSIEADQALPAAAVASGVLGRVRALRDQGLCLRRTSRRGRWSRSRDGRERQPACSQAVWRRTWARAACAALHVQAWRNDQTDPEACYYHAYNLLSRRGALRAWKFLRRVGPLNEAPDRVRSNWMALHAIVLGHLRDFDAAESWFARAEQVAPDRAWILVERADLSQLEDRYDEALAAAREALAVRPWYLPAVHNAAHLLQLFDRDHEAAEFLTEAVERIESSPLVALLGVLQAEMGRHANARRTWDRFAEVSPLLDEPSRRWLAGRRSDTAYDCGEIAQAAAQCARVRRRIFPHDRRPARGGRSRHAPSCAQRGLRAPAPPDLRTGHVGGDCPLLEQANRSPRDR